MSDLDPKMELPPVWQVTISEFRDGAPWPVGTVLIREDGHAVLQGAPGLVFGPLMTSTKRVVKALAETTMREQLMAELAGEAPRSAPSATGELGSQSPPTEGGGE